MNRSLLIVDHLTHSFISPHGAEVLALRDLSLCVQEGEFVALVGPSGCGKSTLLRMVSGLITPQQGRVIYGGLSLSKPPLDVGVVFQKPTLLPWRSVWDNVRLPLSVRGQEELSPQISLMIEAVGLKGFEQALPHQLSGGMQQRVALARALISKPRLLLMDEPFGALDMMLRHEMNMLLLELWHKNHATVLFVTHDIHEAVFLASRVLTMSTRPGHIVGNLPIDLERPRDPNRRYGQDAQAYVEHIWQALGTANH